MTWLVKCEGAKDLPWRPALLLPVFGPDRRILSCGGLVRVCSRQDSRRFLDSVRGRSGLQSLDEGEAVPLGEQPDAAETGGGQLLHRQRAGRLFTGAASAEQSPQSAARRVVQGDAAPA